MGSIAPLILTLEFDEAGFAFFDELRRRHFPPERNMIPAHLTLFHKLPGEGNAEIASTLHALAAETAPFTLDVYALRFLGFGVAYSIRSQELATLRQGLARCWDPMLAPQDRRNFSPHVTIQNKVKAGEAKALHEELFENFEPFRFDATGLLLWHYRGGPWEAAGRYPFSRAK